MSLRQNLCYPSFFPVTPPQYISLYLILPELIMEVLDDPILQIHSLFLRAHTHTHCFGPNSWIKPKYGPEQLICRLVSCWRRKLDAALAALWTTVCQMEAVKSCCRRRLLSALSLWEYRVRIIDHFATRDKKLSLWYGPRTSTPWSQTITGDFLH